MSNETILDLDSLLDSNLGAVKDVPDFVTPPAGTYQLAVVEAKTEKYEKTDKVSKAKSPALRLRIIYKIVSTIETKEMPVSDGSMFSEQFMATEDGLGYFKQRAKKILNVADLGDASIRDVLATLAGAEFKAGITVKVTPAEGGGVYENVNVRPVHDTPAA